MFGLEQKIIVFDTEYTAWEGSNEREERLPGHEKEIIQIGAVQVETREFKELDSFSVLISPKKNPVLSQYIIDLTGITQKDIESQGTYLSTALDAFYKWSSSYPLYSWGDDSETIEENCELIGISSPLSRDRCFDVRDIFSSRGIATEKYMSSTIIEAFGKKKSRHSHDGLSDARSIIDALKELSKDL